jgi:hypothetical protein
MENKSDHLSRRTWFQILGATPVLATAATPVLASAAAPTAEAAVEHPAKTVFTDQQRKTVTVLCDLIIPKDEHSGSASDAGVPAFMEDWLAFHTEQAGNDRLQAEILGGLMWLDRESHRLFNNDFAAASEQQQKQIIDRIAWAGRAAKEDRPWVVFFSSFRDLTVSGFFSSKMGVADLPYIGNTVVTDWKGCDPAVWRVIEERMKSGYRGLINPA